MTRQRKAGRGTRAVAAVGAAKMIALTAAEAATATAAKVREMKRLAAVAAARQAGALVVVAAQGGEIIPLKVCAQAAGGYNAERCVDD